MAAIRDIPLKAIDGGDATLGDHAGKVLLAVNVASQCGLTPQYAALEAVFEKYGDRGFAVLGFPANDFGAQEPGTDDEIASFCETNFGVTFPMFSKIAVNGADRHPLYAALIAAKPEAQGGDGMEAKLEGYGFKRANPSDILWNFEKFLIGRDGNVVARFAPDVAPDSPEIVEAVERELAK
ncbi:MULTISPECIES: glutathione peroxidase [Sphingomonadales]|uniref:Glutathione peroxidase n=2 Tax=Edaphosphingomonas TaxID=3423724 RepID=A0A2T4HQ47_9SPHN|nr:MULTISPECIES: glutathione peroxidase [Sphingomonas]AGH48173.1 glutathione peroxidase [Sphingomonas sp. MM-1]OHT20569.1 Hydroperoxy fatty acid reductase gpx1 [Sphingomonas haloaromaticamans]PTD17924.1 glutathione peroxidase [Sphingomonas fennica]